MTYNYKGKVLTIPDSEISKSMKNLELTKEEAIQLWLEDNDYIVNEQVEELTKKAKDNKTDRVQASSGQRKKNAPRTHKEDATKKELISTIAEALKAYNPTITNTEKYIELEINGENFTINLVKHRKEKKND